VQAGDRLSLEQIRAFLEASSELHFEAANKRELYEWVQRILVEQQYAALQREGKGLIRRYVAKMTGLSRAQVTRLIGQHRDCGRLEARSYQRRGFAARYTEVDAALLAAVDEAHQRLSGPATQQLLQRAFHDFGDARFRQLAQISVAQLYRMRNSHAYRQRRTVFEKTRTTQISIGERRRPEPQGRAGYVRVDTVHQGDDVDGRKGVYHINAVDEVTQWQVVGAVPQISEAWLLPMLHAMLEQFPFRIHGFHSDNGSEFINHRVAGMLKKLLIEQSKSRPRHSSDNGLVEAKNGAVIRKHMGYGHIAAENAAAVEQFYRQHLNPYLNFHRPCAVPEIVTSPQGKRKRVYRWYATPWQILRQLPDLARLLKPGRTVAQLDQLAQAQTDSEAAWQMQEAKRELFSNLQSRRIA